MSNDDLTTLANQFTRAVFDPTAPLPTLWPAGAWGVFLVFVTQIGAGIPLGVLMGRNAGIPPAAMAGLYLASDVVLAVTMEPTTSVGVGPGTRQRPGLELALAAASVGVFELRPESGRMRWTIT